MKKIYFVLFFVLIMLSGCKSKLSDTSRKQEINKNYFSEIKSQIENLKNSDEIEKSIVLKKGIYHFYPEGSFEKELYISNHDQDNPKKVGFYLENLKNVVIDGNGSELIFHGTMIPFVLKNCQNIILKNFSIDFYTPHLRQLKIVEIDKEKNISVVEIYPKDHYKVKNDKLYIQVDDYEYVPQWVMAFREDKKLTYQRADVDFTTKKVRELHPNVLEIQGWSQHKHTAKGERFVLRSYHRPTPSIVVDYCKNTHIENVKIHYAYGMGLLAQLSENITLNKFAVCLKPNDARYFTTQADATHFSACKGLIRSENGLYEAMGDDAINVHGTYLKIIERINENTIRAQYMHPQAWGFLWGEVGDEVQFLSAKTMELTDGKIYKIKAIRAVDKPSEFGAKTFDIVLNENIPQEITSEKQYSIENLTWTPEVIFKNNIIRNNRARGALFSTPRKVVCEGNLFDHTHGTAILLCGDSNGWYETGACRDVLIKNNHFVNALTANYQFTNAIISIYPEIPDLESQKQYFHSNIVIEDNIFELFDEPILYAKSVNNLIFKHNKIIKNTDFNPFHWNKHKFFFERVKNVVIKDNLFKKELSGEKNKLSGIKKHLSEKDFELSGEYFKLSEEDFKINLSDRNEIKWE